MTPLDDIIVWNIRTTSFMSVYFKPQLIHIVDIFQAAEHTVNNQRQLDLNVINPWHIGKL